MNFIFRLFGWFFSNLLLILIVVGICYWFVYRDDPFGQDTPAGKVMAAFPDQTESVKSLISKLKISDEPLFSESPDTDSESSVIVSSVEGEGASADDSDAATASGSEGEQQDAPVVTSSIASGEVVSESPGLAVEPAPVMKMDDADKSLFVSEEIADALNNIKNDGSTVERPPSQQPVASAEPAPQQDSSRMGGFVPDEVIESVERGPAYASKASGEAASAAAGSVGSEAAVAGDDSEAAVAGDDGEAAVAGDDGESTAAGDDSAGSASATDSAETTAAGSREDARELMIDARLAFMQQDYEASVAAYKNLVAQHKDNYDALGELGNVYYNQGDMQKAAESYYQAATIMIAQGKARRAGSLIGFLRSVDQELASKLEQNINESGRKPESL